MPVAIGASVSAGPDAAPSRWADLRRRAGSGLVMALLGLSVIWGGGVVLNVMIGALIVTLWEEWAALCRRGGRTALLLIGLAWIALAGAALVSLRADPAVGRANAMFVALVVCATDIGAYFAGRTIGGPRLAPRISPGKTWSGAAGGMLGGVVAGLIVAGCQGRGDGLALAALVAAILSGVGQLGDLLESLVKRRVGVKDSGRLIPGHGGGLDRLDALLAVLPVAWLLAYLLGRGVPLWE